MAGFVRKKFSDIVQRMIDWTTTYSTKITDFNAGSTVRTIYEAVSWVIEDLYEDLFLGFREMVRLFIYRLFNFERKKARKASLSVQFSANVAPAADITIPIGSVVETVDGVQFETTETATILATFTDSNVVTASALVPGVSGNVSISTVTRIVTDIAGVDIVTNTTASITGQDRETETDQQLRFSKLVTNLAKTTKFGLEAGAEMVAGVYQARIVEHATDRGYLYLYIDDGTGTCAFGASTIGEAVQNKMEGSGTAADPGWRGAGTFIDYKSSTVKGITIVQHLYLRSGVDAPAVVTAVELAQTNYVNKQRMGIDVVKEQLEKIAMQNPDMKDILMTSPAGNTVVQLNTALGEVAKMVSITTTYETFVDTD